MMRKLNQLFLDKREIILICLFYSAAYIPMLVNGWFYFDDPVTSGFRQNLQSLLLTYTEIGWFLAWPAYLHALLFSLGDQAGIYIERSLIFFLYLGAVFCLDYGLENLRRIGKQERLFVVLLFAVLPVNTARIALSNLNYAASYFLFFLGFFFLAAYLRHPGKTCLRLCALAAFFVSFSTNSLLFFYAAAFLFILLFEQERSGGSFVSGLRRAPAYADFIILPVVFWIMLRIFFVPYGNYANQNHLTSHGLLEFYKLLPILLSYMKAVVSSALRLCGLTAIIFALFFARLLEKPGAEEGTVPPSYPALAVFLTGAMLVFTGAFPYLAVLKYPIDVSWLTRHALLLPLGLSLMLVYGTLWVVKTAGLPRVISTFLLCLLAIVHANASNRSYSRFLLEWMKQSAIVEHLRSNAAAENSTTFIFDDKAKEHDGFPQESYRPYTWAAILNMAFNDQARAGFNLASFPDEMEAIKKLPQKYRSQYLVSDYIPGGTTVQVTILPSLIPARKIRSRWKFFYLLTGRLPPEKIKTFIDVKLSPPDLGGAVIKSPGR